MLLSNPVWVALMEDIDEKIQGGAMKLLDMDSSDPETQRFKDKLSAWKELKSTMLAKLHNSR
jgi:hypothetical protein